MLPEDLDLPSLDDFLRKMTEETRQKEEGLRRATIHIEYWRPDHPNLLQIFVWQTHDIFPTFPRMKRLLVHWRDEVPARINTVEIGYVPLGRNEIVSANHLLHLQ